MFNCSKFVIKMSSKNGSKKPSPSKGKSNSPSPKKNLLAKRRNKEELKKTQPKSMGVYIYGCELQGNISAWYFTTNDVNQDSFTWPLGNTLSDTNSTNAICDIGCMGGFYRRRSLEDPRPLYNYKDKYMRKAWIVLLETEEEDCSQEMLRIAQAFKTFWEHPDNNRYNIPVHIGSDWNQTPPSPAPTPKLDHILQCKEAVKLIHRMYAGAGPTWYQHHQEEASLYFTEGHIPFDAVVDLGFPDEMCLPPAPHVTNDPVS